MDVSVLDTDDNRYDPEVMNVKRSAGRFLFELRHDDPVSFSLGDRVQLVLASETFEETDLSERVRKREAIETVIGKCTGQLPANTYRWGVGNVPAVVRVLEAESASPLLEFE